MTMILPTLSREQTYVALATLLPGDLHAHASAANLCYFQVVDHATHAERLFVRVAALPHRLDDLNSSRVFTVYLSLEQLAQALPWDREMQAKATCDVRELIELHTRQSCDGTQPFPDVAPATASVQQQEVQDVMFVALPEVFVSCETVQETITEVQAPNGNAQERKQRRWLQVTWLRAALAMIRRQLAHVTQFQGKLHAFLATLDRAIRCAFVAQHRLPHPLVSSHPVFIGDRQVGWSLVIGIPVSLTQAP